jgi:hypothetical protein
MKATFVGHAMSEFGHGWRQKAGCALLVLAIMALLGWVRSRSACDIIGFTTWGRQHTICSAAGAVYWIGSEFIPCPVGSEAFDRGSKIGENLILGRERYRYGSLMDVNRPLSRMSKQIEDELFATARLESDDFAKWTRPYWSFTIPLTVLSACLILRKPRKQSRQIS